MKRTTESEGSHNTNTTFTNAWGEEEGEREGEVGDSWNVLIFRCIYIYVCFYIISDISLYGEERLAIGVRETLVVVVLFTYLMLFWGGQGGEERERWGKR